MSQNDSITFKEVLSKSETEQLINDLIRKRIQITDPSGDTFIITDIFKDKLLTNLDYKPKLVETKLILELRYDNIKFEFETEVRCSKKQCYLVVPKQIYKLQRRENYRTTIPKSIALEVKCFINDKCIKNAKIINISLTGALFAIKDKENIDFQDNFYAELEYEDQKFQIQGDIVRVDIQSNELLFAVEYNTKMATYKAALHQFLMHCFRLGRASF